MSCPAFSCLWIQPERWGLQLGQTPALSTPRKQRWAKAMQPHFTAPPHPPSSTCLSKDASKHGPHPRGKVNMVSLLVSPCFSLPPAGWSRAGLDLYPMAKPGLQASHLQHLSSICGWGSP